MLATTTLPKSIKDDLASAPAWEELIDITDVVVITGRRRHGKSGLVYWLQDRLSAAHKIPKIAWGIPVQKQSLFPSDTAHFLEIEELDILSNAVIALDEIHQVYSARESISTTNKFLSQAMTFSGQRKQIILMATLNNALIDVNTFRICNPILVYKRVGKLQANSERSATKEFTAMANQMWSDIPGGKRGTSERALEACLSYVVSDEYIGWMWNDLPNWWTQEASEMHSGGKVEEAIAGTTDRLKRGWDITVLNSLRLSLSQLTYYKLSLLMDKSKKNTEIRMNEIKRIIIELGKII